MLYSDQQLGALCASVQQQLHLWFGDTLESADTLAQISLLNVSENVTLLLNYDMGKRILRVHRPNYHSRAAIESELQWYQALARETPLRLPDIISGVNGQAVQTLMLDDNALRHVVMFAFVEGEEPDPTLDLMPLYTQLGVLAAHCHVHAQGWTPSPEFVRPVWDDRAVFGRAPLWGHWRSAPHVSADIADVLVRVQRRLCRRLSDYGRHSLRFGLIHADMRLANILIKNDCTTLIDFDDCGFGWYMYDFAAAVSFIEDDPRIAQWKQAWCEGYQSVRALSAADIDIIDSLVMLRRLNLLGWIGTHSEVAIARQCAPGFARVSMELGKRYLADNV